MSTQSVLKILLCAFFVIGLSTSVYAQENRILMTTNQQYQNIVPNSSFEAWDFTNAKPSDWTKIDAPTLVQEGTIIRIGAKALKITSAAGTTSQGVSYSVAIEPKTTYTFSCYYYSAAGNQAEVAVVGDVTSDLVADTVLTSTAGAWKRYSITFTTVTDTIATINLYAKANSGATKTAYFDAVSLTEGVGTPAFTAHPIADTGNHTMYGNLTVKGTTNLDGDVNLGSISTNNITVKGTLKSPSATDVSIQSTTGILRLDKASVDNELRIFENAATPTAYTSLRHQNITTSTGNITINPAGGTTAVTGALTASTTITATGNISGAQLSTDGSNYYDFGNATGNVPVSNGTVNTNLNADKIDSLDVSASGANAHVLATDSSGNISVVNTTASGYLATGSAPAATGQIRLPNAAWINARNAGNTADINLISLNASNQVSFGTTPVAAFTAAGTITGSSSPVITGFGTINGATLSGGTLSGGAYSGTSLTPTTLASGDGVVYTIQPTINVSTPGTTGYTALKVGVTETSVGSGTKNLLDLSVGASQKFVVDSTGQLTTGIIPGSKVNGNISGNAANVTGIVASANGGTGANLSGGAQGGITYMAGSSVMSVSAAGSSGQVLQSGGTGAPTWTTDISGNAANVNGTVAVNHGGTGLTSYTTGDLVYASGAATLAKLADVATGSVLVSGGTGAAPSYSSSPTISGTLTVQGSGDSSFTNGRLGIGISPSAPIDVAKTYTTASATDYGAIIEPTYNVATSGPTNKYTALLVKATESNLAGYGSTKLLLDLQAGSTPASKFSVDNSGNITQASGATINGQTIGATTSLAAVNVSGAVNVGGGYGSSGLTIDTDGNLSLDGNILLKGTVYRPTTEELRIKDNILTLNADAVTDLDATIQVEKSGAAVSYIKWSPSNGYWEFNKDINLVTGKAFKINNASILSASTLGSSVVNSSLQSLGTVTTGVWQASTIAVDRGGTNLTSYAAGDLLYASGAATIAKLGIGTANKVLTSSGTAPQWSDSLSLGGTLAVSGAGDSSFVGKVGIGTAGPAALLDIYNKPANASGLATAALIKPDYSLLNTAGDGYTALKVNVTDAQAGATGAKNLLDLQVGGASKVKVDSAGAMTIQGLTIGSTALTSSTAGSEGAKLVGTKTAYTHFTATEASVQGALTGIDTALGAISGGSGSFTNLIVTGTADMQGAISNSTAANGGAVTVADLFSQTGGGQVSFSGNVDAANGVDITGALNLAGGTTYKVTSTGDATFKDVNVSSLTSSGNIITTGTGAITSANGLTVSANGASITGGLNNNTNGITNAGAISGATTVVASSYIRSLASVGLIPEYDNATPRPDGVDNFGTLSLQYGNSHNYYEWTTSEPTTQDYDIVIRYRLPDGFSSFDATPIKLWNKVSTTPGSTKVDVTMLDTAGNAVTLTNGSTLQNTSWAESEIGISGSPVFTAGGYITITIKMSADQGKVADVGELTLKGNW